LNRSVFSKRIQFAFASASKFSYRLSATNNAGRTGYWPADGSYFEVAVSRGVSGSIGADGGKLVLLDGDPEAGPSVLNVPSGALDSVHTITMTELDPEDTLIPPGNYPALTSKPVSVYSFDPSGTVFNKPIKLSLAYPDADRNGVVDGTLFGAGSLKVMWWDGFDWRVVGTGIDANASLATAMTKHFSLYAVFPVGDLRDEDYRPREKIITPATLDGHNDTAVFGALGPDDVVNIYDVNGRRVRQLKSDNTQWDGKDDDGKLAESGLYLYQIKLVDKVISGTIVVAK
jgi:hypothetical protein